MTHDKSQSLFIKGPIDIRPLDVNDYLGYLNDEELNKMRRFKTEALQRDFALARGLLKKHLGEHLGVLPAQLEFAYGEHGKPYLIDHAIEFNLSHTKNQVLIGMSTEAIGVDIEFERERVDGLALAKRFFAETEYAWLKALPVDQQQRAFYQLWVCKEAVVKALGAGLVVELKSFTIEIEDNQAKLLHSPWANHLSLRLLKAPDGYQAALAVMG